MDEKIAKTKRAIVVIALLGLYMVLAAWLTGTSCWLKSTVGLPCPGCGLTRAYRAVWGRDLAAAFYWHPLFWYVPVFAMVWLGKWLRYRRETPRWFRVYVIASLAVLVAVYALRMLWYFPHTEPFDFNINTPIARIVRWIIGL